MFRKNRVAAMAVARQSRWQWRVLLPLLAAAVLLVGGCGKISEWLGDAADGASVETVEGGLDWQQPDALIRTQSLADVPADLLTVPLARDLLTEDFLFFYEQEERFLSISGAVRRVAYEHELQWGDHLLRMVLDEPADIAFWRGSSGAIEQFAIAADRGRLASLLMQAGKLKFKDSNLRELFTLRADGDDVPVYALGYSNGRELVFAAHGSRVVLASSRDMVQDSHNRLYARAHKALTALLDDSAGASGGVFAAAFADAQGSESAGRQQDVKHSVLVRTHFLSLGYQRFFPALQALRFDFGSKGDWQTSVLLDGSRVKAMQAAQAFSNLPQYMPQQAAACVALPVQWSELNGIAQSLSQQVQAAAAAFAQRAQGPLGVCWSDTARLHSPVFMVQFSPAADDHAANADSIALKQAVPELMRAFVRSGTLSENGQVAGDTAFQSLQHTWGSKKQYHAELVYSEQLLIVSPDAALARAVQAVAQRTRPALSDVLTEGVAERDDGLLLAYFAPARLGALAQKEIHNSLPGTQDSVLRTVAEERIAPRLRAVERHQPVALLLPQAAMQSDVMRWHEVSWRKAAAAQQ